MLFDERVKVIATGRRVEPIEQTIAEIKELGGEGDADMDHAVYHQVGKD